MTLTLSEQKPNEAPGPVDICVRDIKVYRTTSGPLLNKKAGTRSE